MHDQEKHSAAIPLSDLKVLASLVAEQLGGLGDTGLPADVRAAFIDVRAALFQRGIYDPVLIRFDSATVPRAPVREIAARLAQVADSL